MFIEYNKNISKVTIDVREFMDETKDCARSEKAALEWLRKFRSELFFSLIEETLKRSGECRCGS